MEHNLIVHGSDGTIAVTGILLKLVKTRTTGPYLSSQIWMIVAATAHDVELFDREEIVSIRETCILHSGFVAYKWHCKEKG